MTRGWKPAGVVPLNGSPSTQTRLDYFPPSGQSVTENDAQELARCLESALSDVSDTVVDLSDRGFGDDHTMDLIRQAASGATPDRREGEGAVEILSGPPKVEARTLVEFLLGGTFTIHPAQGR